MLETASPMHDVGKIGIPDAILLKPGKLTSEEFEIMKRHAVIGYELLSKDTSIVLQVAAEIALTHHEKWNGKGYPYGISGDSIPLFGRIVGIVDVFDALTSKRVYKDRISINESLDIMKKERGSHFDPELFDLFLANVDLFIKEIEHLQG